MDAIQRNKLYQLLGKLRDSSLQCLEVSNECAIDNKSSLVREAKQTLTYSKSQVRSFPKISQGSLDLAMKSLMEKGYVFSRDETSSSARYQFTTADIRVIYDELGIPSFAEHNTISGRENNAIVIAGMNLKGGVGKTTSMTSLAASLIHSKNMVHHRFRILLIDLDPQGSASMVFGINDLINRNGNSAIKAIIEKSTKEQLKEMIFSTNNPGLDLLPASHADEYFSVFVTSLIKENNQINIPLNQLLDEYVIKPLRSEYDIIIIDCPPRIDAPVINAVHTADAILIPLCLEPLEFDSSVKFSSRFIELAEVSNPINLNHKKIKFFASKFDYSNQIHEENYDTAKMLYADMMMSATIPYIRALSSAFINQETIYNVPPKYYPGDTKTLAKAKSAIDEFSSEVVRKIILAQRG